LAATCLKEVLNKSSYDVISSSFFCTLTREQKDIEALSITNILSRNRTPGINVAGRAAHFLHGCPKKSVLLIRIRMFFGLLDPDPDPIVRGTNPDLSSRKNSTKILDF
jgi:hypothetical protein